MNPSHASAMTDTTSVRHLFDNSHFVKYLMVIGCGLIGASVVYLIGANWFMLPKLAKLAIAPTLLAVFAGLSTLPRLSDTVVSTLQTLAGLMMGLSMAVIGQVYQTGADSAWLFIVWTLLLLPWCYRHNAGVFVLLGVVSQTALWLAYSQFGWANDNMGLYLLLASVLAAAGFVWSLRHYPLLAYVYLAAFVVLSIGAAFVQSSVYSDDGQWAWVSIFLTPLLAIYAGRHYQRPIITSLGMAILGTSLFVWLMFSAFKDIGSFFAVGVLALVWFGVVGAIVFAMFPKGRLHVVPLAVGGWIAGLVLSLAIMIDVAVGVMVVGGLCWLAGMALLKWGRQQVFLRHLGYALFVAGQLASLYWLGGQVQDNTLAWLIAQVITVGILWWLRSHWLFLLGQGLGLYLLAQHYFMYNGAVITLLYTIVMAGVLLLPRLSSPINISNISTRNNADTATNNDNNTDDNTDDSIDNRTDDNTSNHTISHQPYNMGGGYLAADYFYLLSLFVLSVVGIWVIKFYGISYALANEYYEQSVMFDRAFYYSLPVLALLMWQWLRQGSSLISLIGMMMLAVGCALLGHGGVFFVFVVLAYAIIKQDKLVQACAVLLLIGIMWHLYYSLSLTFLMKFVSILVSGVLMIVLARVLQIVNQSTENHQTNVQGIIS